MKYDKLEEGNRLKAEIENYKKAIEIIDKASSKGCIGFCTVESDDSIPTLLKFYDPGMKSLLKSSLEIRLTELEEAFLNL